MIPLKIGIVEDDLIIAQSISDMLAESGYASTRPAKRYSEAIAMIEEGTPDLLLLDVMILGKMDGIEVGRTVQKEFGIPFIFLTANTDFETIRRAKEVAPAAFLAKPVTKGQLFAAIEIAMANSMLNTSKVAPAGADNHLRKTDTLFVKHGYNYRKVEAAEIVFAESEQNYVALQLRDGSRVTMRATILDFLGSVDTGYFLRVHRSFIVATAMIDRIESNTLFVGPYSIPIGKSYRDEVLRSLGLRR